MSEPHRAIGWKYDLPAIHAPSLVKPGMADLDPPPNHVDEIAIEIPRPPLKLRGLSLITGTITLIATTSITAAAIYYNFFLATRADLEFIALFLGANIMAILLLAPYIRMDIEQPRDEPIRFNRQRRKVYFYQYKTDLFHPFSIKRWGIKPVVYDWDDLTAEAYRLYAPMGYGGLMEKVMISICKPGTNEVIDRVLFADSIETGEQYWAIVRLFMQQGPEALPDFVHSPWDWNEGVHSNPFDQRAPKVQWPAEMDLESRTAPPEEHR
ncbi:DUF6708 domain-containing protein [Pseudomonas sp. CC120222-01a]|uniref:DUF6708 domain-containing protein n=1 Tax=Pseudomonas sp. CC120222-01a TaxID=1378075 RepID=UPI000D9DDCBB|nr:DUF6708 domain-containing protein [Pseudomonas sp. CC120222-01a]PVZ42634.1 hypothetical protein N430_01247 [Pseudomonas sp. CC120222-01a]